MKQNEKKESMTKTEREDLQRLIRQREKVLKSAAKQRSAELLADFENQMGSEYAFDDDAVWAQAVKAAEPASEVRFLNPGVETCIANCKARPWEPQKYPSRRAQDQKLEFLLDWVREYESRTDEYSLLRHRELFEGFPGPKVELLSLTDR